MACQLAWYSSCVRIACCRPDSTETKPPAGGGPVRSAMPNHGWGATPLSNTATTGLRPVREALRGGGAAESATGIRLPVRART